MTFLNNLYDVYRRNEIVSLYLARNTDVFVCGFIIAMTERELIFQDLEESGHEEAIMLIPISQIVRYEFAGLYEKKMKILYNFWYKNKKNEFLNWKENDLTDEFFSYVQQKKEYIGVFGFEKDLYGKIITYTPEIIQFQIYNLYGESDGISFLQRDEIDVVEMNSKNCTILKILESIENK